MPTTIFLASSYRLLSSGSVEHHVGNFCSSLPAHNFGSGNLPLGMQVRLRFERVDGGPILSFARRPLAAQWRSLREKPDLDILAAHWLWSGSVWQTLLMCLLVFGYRKIVFSIFLQDGYHRVHSLLNLADLRMHILDEVMFEIGQLFDAFALRVKLIQQGFLFC